MADKPGNNDIVVAAPTGELYWIKEDVWKETQLPPAQTGQMADLVNQGVVLANIGPNSQPGTGCACYLLNLANIATAAKAAKKAHAAHKKK